MSPSTGTDYSKNCKQRSFSPLCKFISLVPFLGQKCMLNLHVSASAKLVGLLGSLSPAGLVQEGYQAGFHVFIVSVIPAQPPWAGRHCSANGAWHMVGPVLNELADISKWYRQQHWQLAVTQPHSKDRKGKPSLSPCYTQSMSLVTKEARHTQPNICPDTWQHQFCRTWICTTPAPHPCQCAVYTIFEGAVLLGYS